MILHQQLLQPPGGISLPWLALHAESLTLALCEPLHGNIIEITRIQPFASPIHNTVNPTANDLFDIADNIRHHVTHVRTQIVACESPLSTLNNQLSTSSPYLLVNSLDGTTPGILHTQDPVALYLADDSGTLGNASHFRSSSDLTAEGWAYWWEDAQRAFHKLTVAFMQEAGIPVPEHIAGAVKHD